MRLIGINGFKTSGKDTTFAIIESIYAEKGLVAKRAAFADKLKIMAVLALGIERKDDALVLLADSMKSGAGISVLYDEPGAVASDPHQDNSVMHFLTGRAYLQNFGNHARRVFGDTFWIDQVLPDEGLTYEGAQQALAAMYPGADVVVVTDVRYTNEAERVLDLYGEVWEVVRPGIESDGHASETPLHPGLVDFHVVNDGSISDLTKKVLHIIG
jgi:hypothetical protein